MLDSESMKIFFRNSIILNIIALAYINLKLWQFTFNCCWRIFTCFWWLQTFIEEFLFPSKKTCTPNTFILHNFTACSGANDPNSNCLPSSVNRPPGSPNRSFCRNYPSVHPSWLVSAGWCCTPANQIFTNWRLSSHGSIIVVVVTLPVPHRMRFIFFSIVLGRGPHLRRQQLPKVQKLLQVLHSNAPSPDTTTGRLVPFAQDLVPSVSLPCVTIVTPQDSTFLPPKR